MLPPVAISYNADGIASLQQVFRRVGEHDLYVGLAWIYMDIDLSFDSDGDRDRFTEGELASRSSGLGLSLEYDSRDNPFTPSRGWLGAIEGNAYDHAIGSDNDFQSYRSHGYAYFPLHRRMVLGARVDLRWANGDIPFYRLPYIDLRGIGSARYQDRRAAVLETEARWSLGARWALVGFIGAGRTWGRHNDFGDASSRVAKGSGFRYLLARQLGMYAGIDYAWGPEDETFYIQVGSAWR
ncbi:BamA/TamA family outer membrane protein [Pseudoxanthomonas sp. Root630]|uniref:BamA/TamA family outer membrane protein n=1 Tax=Pseudoxanthomonas sp. Root630 TaxID=1736574 RepID=UPI000AD6FABA|nr:BamA/TamA family outer membrane protein [Pseudoxanthomonas sp. Root630]